jgi:hypothetical protein
MRHTSDPRPAGYSIAIVLLLVAPYCALAGSEWIGAAGIHPPRGRPIAPQHCEPVIPA